MNMITAIAKDIVALETKGMFWTMSVKGDVCVFLVMFLYLFPKFNYLLTIFILSFT